MSIISSFGAQNLITSMGIDLESFRV